MRIRSDKYRLRRRHIRTNNIDWTEIYCFQTMYDINLSTKYKANRYRNFLKHPFVRHAGMRASEACYTFYILNMRKLRKGILLLSRNWFTEIRFHFIPVLSVSVKRDVFFIYLRRLHLFKAKYIWKVALKTTSICLNKPELKGTHLTTRR